MSCLFESLGRLTGYEPSRMRAGLCNYLSSDPVLYSDGTRASQVVVWESGARNLDDYVRRMRSSSTWGGAIEIKAFVDWSAIPVVVYDTRRKPWQAIRFTHNQPASRHCLRLAWNGAHYEPLR